MMMSIRGHSEEERPTLVLPWLLLAAIRKLLCELTSLALGLGTCVLLGPARPPCIKFVVIKVISIMPAFYMWMLVISYYHALKVASAFKTFPVVLPPSDHDYGLELAVRRRRTKSLLGEEQLRTKLVASFYGESNISPTVETLGNRQNSEHRTKLIPHSADTSVEDIKDNDEFLQPTSITSNRIISDAGSYEDWFGNEVIIPRDTDRILEQFVLMLLRIGAYYKKESIDSITLFKTLSPMVLPKLKSLACTTLSAVDTETPPLVGSSRGNTASYLRQYPQIFMKKPEIPLQLRSEHKFRTEKTEHRQINSNDDVNVIKSRRRSVSSTPNQTISLDIEKITTRKKMDVQKSPEKKKLQSTKSVSTKHQKLRLDSKSKELSQKDLNSKRKYKIDKKRKELNKDMKLSSVDSLKSVIERMKSRLTTNSTILLDVNSDIAEKSTPHDKTQYNIKPTSLSVKKEYNKSSVSSSTNLKSHKTSNAGTSTSKNNDTKK